MIGAIIGDIVGSRFERSNCKSVDFELFTEKCHFTDDTVMTLAVAKALLESDGDLNVLSANAVKCMQEIGRRYPNCGYGQMFWLWLHKRNSKPYNSLGNGSAMRVSPVAYAAETMEQCLDFSDAVTNVSHNHHQGVLGAQAAAAATWAALHDWSKQEIGALIQDQFYDLSFTIDELRPHYRFDATCQGSVPQAIKAFLESNDFEDAIRLAVSIGGDSDTIAAIAGGIGGAYYGVPDQLRAKAMEYLPEDLRDILVEFEATYRFRNFVRESGQHITE